MARFRPGKWTLVTILLGVGAYVLFRFIRTELVDFEVYRTAAARAMASQPLFRLDDGHYQYKYLPAFALVMAPLAWLPKALAEALWFALSVAMAAWFVRLSLSAVPERRLRDDALIWLGLLLMGKFLVKEIAFGQTNVLLGIVLLTAALAAERGHRAAAGVLVGVGVFVKPYALVFVPWLVWVSGAIALASFLGVMAIGLLIPVPVYGWAGNLELLRGWYQVVTTSTAHTLLGHDNISFASMWAKWWGSDAAPIALAAVSSALALAVVAAAVLMRRRVRAPACLEYGMLAVLVPLISPQGWDYLLVVALPGYLCLVDRWRETPKVWHGVLVGALFVTNFAIYDLMRRPLYMFVMSNGIATLGALALVVCLLRLRWRGLA
jgi:hypothetical protein